MREEFQKRRGYDPLRFLPAMTGRVVDSLDVSERFLWDLRQTISDLVIENYAGRMQQLARQNGLRLTIEAYGGPCDDIPYAGRADEPMGEFGPAFGSPRPETSKEMASAAHSTGGGSSARNRSPPATTSAGSVTRPASRPSAMRPSVWASTGSCSTVTPCSRGCNTGRE